MGKKCNKKISKLEVANNEEKTQLAQTCETNKQNMIAKFQTRKQTLIEKWRGYVNRWFGANKQSNAYLKRCRDKRKAIRSKIQAWELQTKINNDNERAKTKIFKDKLDKTKAELIETKASFTRVSNSLLDKANVKSICVVELNKADSLNSEYKKNTDFFNSQLNVYEKYSLVNEQMDAKLAKQTNNINTNLRKTDYEISAYENLNLWYIIFYRMYFFLVLVLAISIFITSTTSITTQLSTISKAAIIGGLVIYPYIVYPIANYLYKLISNIFSYIPINVYNSI